MISVLTNCSNRKRLTAVTGAANLPRGNLQEVAESWTLALNAARPVSRALDLYCGRSIREASAAAQLVNATITIASAGLGLVSGHTPIPSYDLTVSPGSDHSVLTKIEPKVSSQQWWSLLRRKSPIQQCAAIQESDTVLVALSAPYLSMLRVELSQIATGTDVRVRIFTGASELDTPIDLRPYVMPYDRRLNDPEGGWAGTGADFPQRALRHFVTTIIPTQKKGNPSEDASAVEQSLSDYCEPCVTDRKRLSDDEVIDLIRTHWNDVCGRSGRMLRFLRDELSIACEQDRFKHLFHQVKDERRTTL